MKKLFFFVIAGVLMSACSNTGNKVQTTVEPADQNQTVITNDLENAMAVIPSWQNENTIKTLKEIPAHSGQYLCVTNDTLQYSYTYKEFVKNITNKIPKMVVYSGWIYTTVANPNFAIVCSINENNQNYDWKAFPLDKELKETGKWVEFTASFFFDKKPLKPEHEIGLFAWNQSKKAVYIDDLKITFVY
jgi:hypothetical protein